MKNFSFVNSFHNENQIFNEHNSEKLLKKKKIDKEDICM